MTSMESRMMDLGRQEGSSIQHNYVVARSNFKSLTSNGLFGAYLR